MTLIDEEAAQPLRPSTSQNNKSIGQTLYVVALAIIAACCILTIFGELIRSTHTNTASRSDTNIKGSVNLLKNILAAAIVSPTANDTVIEQ